MADSANDDGERLWLSIAAIAKKSSISERQAQRVIKSLCDSGFLSVIANENGGKPGTTKHHRINLDAIGIERNTTDDKMSVVGIDEGVTPEVKTGDAGDTQSIKEPLVKKEAKASTKAASSKLEIPDWMPEEAWQDWIKYRREMKKPMTHVGAIRLISKIDELVEQGYDAAKLIYAAIDHSWQGIFPCDEALGGCNKKPLGKQGIPILTGRDAEVML